MEDLLIELVSSLGYPVFRQGSLTEDETYPSTFFTYWNNTEINHSAYDNDTAIMQYEYDLNVYSTSIDTCYELLDQATKLLKEHKFIVTQFGFDLYSDEITHVGRGINVSYLGDYDERND